MFSVRWRKVLRDLWSNEIRTVMAILAMAIGIISVGAILSAYAILTREITVNFMGTNPASAILYVNGADRQLADQIQALPGVATAEPRRVISARFLVGPNEWRPILLYVIDDFNHMQLATFTTDSGDWPPKGHETLIERSSLVDSKTGDTITIRTPNGINRDVRIGGIVHDPAQAPGWQDRVAYGYITLDTLKWLGETPEFDELRFVVSDNALDVPHITTVAYQVKQAIEQRGYQVTTVWVPKPGQHPHTDQMESLLFLQEAFGILALVLSAVLVANIISALLAQQIRQIGAMKAIGGRTRQIVGLYFGAVLILGVAALGIGIPMGQAVGWQYALFTAGFLNFTITSDSIPHWVYIAQIAVGLTVPLLAAAIPVWRGSQITVREAISDYGIGANNFGGSAIDTLVTRIRGLSRPLLLSLRNTFRRRARTILTIATLAVGGATFMSAIFVGDSWYRTIEKSFEARHYDMEVRFSQPYPSDQVGKLVSAVPGVERVETWAQLLTVRERPDGTDGERFNVTGLPPTSDMLAFPVIEGRWLRPGDTNAVVINHELLLDPEANIKLGDHLTLRFGDKTSEWEVVGVVREVGAPRRGLGIAAAAYVPLDYLEKMSGIQGMTTNVRIRTSGHDDAFVTGVSQKLEQQFDAADMRRITIQLSTERKHVLEEHLVVIVAALLVLAGLVAAVGGLGLASSMSINVMERAREIGVLRAIGASTRAIMQMVISEGLIIGLLSWALAIALAIPLSNLVGDFAGQIFIRAPLDHIYPLYAMAEWLGLALAISVVASVFPARSAARLTVREALAYE